MSTTDAVSMYTLPAETADTIVLSKGHVDEGNLFRTYAWLRANNPLGLAYVDGYDPLWLVAKHADIMEIERQPDIFTSGGGEDRGSHNPILQNRAGDSFIRSVNGGTLRIGDAVTNMDPPEHSEIKDIAAAWFRPTALKKLDGRIRDLAQNAVSTRLRPGTNDIDFTKDFAFLYPLHVVMTLLGVPEEDEPLMLSLTQELFGAEDPDTGGTPKDPLTPEAAGKQFIEAVFSFNRYFDTIVDDRRNSPRDDMATVIASARDANGEYYDRSFSYGWFASIATAGHDTTSSTLSTILERLGSDPALLAEVKADVGSAVGPLVEEGLRWASPVKHFVRRATEDYELRGRTIKSGDRLMLLYQSANRDEDVFDAPNEFNLGRHPNPHIAFGYGPHMCIGQHLAKRELRIMLEVLLPRVRSIELKPGQRVAQTNFVGGIKNLPMRLEIE